MIMIETVTSFEGFLQLEPVWNGVLEKSDVHIPFLTFQWLKGWWQSYGEGNEMLILLAKEDGRITGIAPCMLTLEHRCGIPLRTLRFMANYHTNRFDFIVNGDKKAVVTAMLDHLAVHYRNIDTYLFDFLQHGCESELLLANLLDGKNKKRAKLNSILSPYIQIAQSWEAYWPSLSKRWRRKISDTSKLFARNGDGTIIKYTGAEIDKAFDELLTVSRKTWQYENGTAIASTEKDITLYYSIARDMAKNGMLRLWILKIDALPVAFLYAIEYANKLFAMKIGFNQEYSHFSPGVFLSTHVIKECFDHKLAEFDWLGENNDYKMKWTSLCRQHVRHRVYNTTLAGLALYYAENLAGLLRGLVVRFRAAFHIPQEATNG